MPVAAARPSLVEQVLQGGNRELKVLAARGLMPLEPVELLPLQVKLTRDEDPEVAGRAAAVLRLADPRLLADFVAVDAGEEELAYFAAESDHPQVIETLVRRRDVPRRLLVQLARRLDPALQEILILRQDAIVEEPAILDALEANPRLESYVRRRIGEYRQHLLPRERVEEPEAPEEEGEEEEEADDARVQAALAEASARPPRGEVDESTGLSEGQIRQLPVPVRLRLARGAPRSLRGILLRDTNPRVAVSVLVNNAVGDEEVEQIARSRVVVDDVLVEISRHREWNGRYPIVNALVANPRTPVGIALRLLPRLGVRDLRALSRSRGISDAVRNAARQLFATRTR